MDMVKFQSKIKESIHDDTGSALHVKLITEHDLRFERRLCRNLPVFLCAKLKEPHLSGQMRFFNKEESYYAR